MKLREFKARNISVIARLMEELPPRYGAAVAEVLERLLVKTQSLRRYTLADYLFTIAVLSKAYPELRALMPSPEETEDLLREEGEEE